MGIRVLSRPDEATRIALAGRQLTKLFKNNRLDVEWVYAGPQLYIVQARPLVGL